jgi:hypothetical protein
MLHYFAAEYALRFYKNENTHSPYALTSTINCPTKDELIQLHTLPGIYGDGGFRNTAYTKSNENYVQAWADTMCMDRHIFKRYPTPHKGLNF